MNEFINQFVYVWKLMPGFWGFVAGCVSVFIVLCLVIALILWLFGIEMEDKTKEVSR